MQSERSIGTFIFICALICLTIAVDKYYSAIKTADQAAEVMPWFELEAVGIPVVTLVCGTLGVTLLVASVILIAKSFRQARVDA